jgi:3-deoxy-D-manno-oct-2-ulosonic acid (Kdo) hydroxylase
MNQLRKEKNEAAAAEVLTLDQDVDLSAQALQHVALETLEGGGVVFLPGTGFELTAKEREIISDTKTLLVKEPEFRNGRPTIIFDPQRGKIRRHYALVHGKPVTIQVQRAVRPDIEAMLARFGTWAERLIAKLFPSYGPVLAHDRITYRPNERDSMQPLHVDSSYGFPTQGRGMFRLFCNIDPANRPRVWQVGEPFEPFVRRFLPSVHLRPASWTSALLARLGIVRGSKLPYDQMIAELRRLGKRDKQYQSTAPRRTVEFPAGSCWFAITDLVLHGAASGQHSLDQTFFLPADGMGDPSRSSLRILERLSGRPLV